MTAAAARATIAISGDTLAVSGVLDFETVLELDEPALVWLRGDAPVQCRVDLAAVSYSSSVGVALVLGWLRAAIHAGKTLRIDNMPADIAALARVGGLQDLLTAP